MICVECHQPTDSQPCTACGGAPVLDGRWLLEAIVGRGANGTVFRARALSGDGGAVAIKELPLRADPKRQDLALREARVLRQLNHPAIPRYLEEIIAGTGRGRCLYLVEEFVEGESLAAILGHHRFHEREVLAIMATVLDVLAWLHALSPPVIHRDVKPGNLILRAVPGPSLTDLPDLFAGEPAGLAARPSWALVDFGSVRDVLRAEDAGSTVAGTFGYMAPEQFRGEALPATDLFGVGATAIALLSRRDPAELHDRDGRFVWRSAVVVSPAFEALLGDILVADPRKRLGDARIAAVRARALMESGTPRRGGATPTAPGALSDLPEQPLRGVGPRGPSLDDLHTPELPVPGRADRVAANRKAASASVGLVGLVGAVGLVITGLAVAGLLLAGNVADPVARAQPPAVSPMLPAPLSSDRPRSVHSWRSKDDPDESPDTVTYPDHPVPEDLVGQPTARGPIQELNRPRPTFPEETNVTSAECHGTLDVNPDGTVGRATIEGCPVEFRDAFALGSWRFEPLAEDAKRVERAFDYTWRFSKR